MISLGYEIGLSEITSYFGVFEMLLIYITVIGTISIPVFLIILILFHYLKLKIVEVEIARIVIIGVTILGIFLTLFILVKKLPLDIFIPFSIAAIISGMLIKLKRNVNQEDIPNQSRFTQNED
ncbi:hypothetical protein DXU93_05225 [Brumimicrobium aurantiacum]|uniref:Uncharacterized protein n=2 Tax=Brumimicrobium aurantiacum TaxID=1737063 RepID=A0A3E1F089_9FLAO|nr:hypothetical protein DXU93_05225 [Brumimicrobium aurantiacum]